MTITAHTHGSLAYSSSFSPSICSPVRSTTIVGVVHPSPPSLLDCSLTDFARSRIHHNTTLLKATADVSVDKVKSENLLIVEFLQDGIRSKIWQATWMQILSRPKPAAVGRMRTSSLFALLLVDSAHAINLTYFFCFLGPLHLT